MNSQVRPLDLQLFECLQPYRMVPEEEREFQAVYTPHLMPDSRYMIVHVRVYDTQFLVMYFHLRGWRMTS